MKRLLILTVMALGLAASHGAIYTFNLSLDGLQEVGPNASPGTGTGTALFDDSTTSISLSLNFSALTSSATASHIHLGAPGVNGGVIVSFVPYTPAATSGTITGGPLPFPSANVAALMAGNTYFNIHTANYPGGEIRGQLVLVPEPSAMSLAALGGLALIASRRRR